MKPPLDSCLLHLHKSDGTQSDYVVLLGPDRRAQGFYDRRNATDEAMLQSEYSRLYESDEEREVRFRAEEARLEADRFAKATKIPAAKWTGAVFHDDKWFESVEDFEGLFAARPEGGLGRPAYLWAAKNVEPRLRKASDLWSDYMEQLDPLGEYEEEAHGQYDLNKALDAFHTANPFLFSRDEIDHSTAITL